MTPLEEKMMNALNKLAKWRSVFAGWQLGSRLEDDPECQAVRDHREVTMLLRAEVNALTRMLLDAGLVKQEDFQKQLIEEAEFLHQQYKEKFPGMEATDVGVSFKMPEAAETMKRMNWKP